MPERDAAILGWLERLRAGDRDAAGLLWNEYRERMVWLARAELGRGGRGRVVSDEEDAALTAFESFCAGVGRGRFTRLDGSHALGRLLATITVRQVRGQLRRERRLRRGAGRVRRETDLGRALETLPASGLGPPRIALARDEVAWRLHRLGRDDLRRVATLRLDGWTRAEIAARLGCSPRTVARLLAQLRHLWIEADQDPPTRAPQGGGRERSDRAQALSRGDQIAPPPG